MIGVSQMDVQFSEPQLDWLRARVADGTFASVLEALQQLVDEQMALESSDLDWALPLVEEARADVAAGRLMELDEHRARNASRLQALRG